MTNLFLIGAMDACGGLLPIVRVLVQVIKILMIVIPIALILLGTIDLGKAVIASDDKEVKAAQSRLIKRFIYAALIFFVGVILHVLNRQHSENLEHHLILLNELKKKK